MPAPEDDFTIGVEEEFFLVDRTTRALVPVAPAVLPEARVLAGDDVQFELQQAQIETSTRVCHTLDEVRQELRRLRHALADATAGSGCAIVSSGSHPLDFEEASRVTREPKYLQLERDYRLVTHEQMVAGCHVHVGLTDPEAVIQVMNRARPWLAVLLALTANSPFWKGRDSGYASFRTEVWRRWPTAGIPEAFASRAEYDEVVDALLAVDGIDDPARIYWDVRPSARFGTLEFRIADAGLTVDEVVMTAGLVRGLVRSCHSQVVAGEPLPLPRPELLRAAAWRAARYGVAGTLIDLDACRAVPAPAMVESLLAFVRPALEEAGDLDKVSAQVETVLDGGTGAERQRRAFASRHRLEDVVDFLVAETAR
jgi:carboxylate-amine ligase